MGAFENMFGRFPGGRLTPPQKHMRTFPPRRAFALPGGASNCTVANGPATPVGHQKWLRANFRLLLTSGNDDGDRRTGLWTRFGIVRNNGFRSPVRQEC